MGEYTDLCVSCSSAVKTFANLQIARDEKHLVPRYMPPGGCTCTSVADDAACLLCFPVELRCIRCECDPCTLPRAHGGRCPSTDTDIDGARSSHCIPCAFCCDDEGGD